MLLGRFAVKLKEKHMSIYSSYKNKHAQGPCPALSEEIVTLPPKKTSICVIPFLNMYVRIYVSLYLCIFVSMYLCIYVSMYLCIYVSMYLCIYVSMYLCMYLCMYVCMHACMCVCIHLSMYVSMYLCTFVSMYLCIYACMHVCAQCVRVCRVFLDIFLIDLNRSTTLISVLRFGIWKNNWIWKKMNWDLILRGCPCRGLLQLTSAFIQRVCGICSGIAGRNIKSWILDLACGARTIWRHNCHDAMRALPIRPKRRT